MTDDTGNCATPIILDPAGADVHAEIAAIRVHGPITLVELPGQVPAWSVTDRALLEALLTDPRVTRDVRTHWPPFRSGTVGPDWTLWPWVAVTNLLSTGGIDHKRLRRLVAPSFTARRTRALQPRIAAITTELLNALAATATGQVIDLREHFACPLPIRVIGELMDVPHDLSDQLRIHADATLDTTLEPSAIAAAFGGLHEVVDELLAHKRSHPGDDLTTELITTSDKDGHRLSPGELADTLLLIIVAGHETTANLLDHTIHALLTHPEHRAAAHDHLQWAEIVEEALRFEAPLAHMPLRVALEDITLPGGHHIARGDAILATFGAVGRDPKLHTYPDEFDPYRMSKAHMAFGYGAHHCLGAPLARLEASIAVPALFERFPALRSAATDPDDLGYLPSLVVNGHARLPVYLN